MQFLVAALLGGLLQIAGSLAGRVLLALGFSFVTYSGFQLGIDWLLNEIKSGFSGMPAEVVSFLAWLWLDKAISMVFSAYSAALGLRMLGGSSVTKMVLK